METAPSSEQSPVLGIENAEGNLNAKGYWNTLPEFAGQEYAGVAGQNLHEMQKMRGGMYGVRVMRGGQEMSPADATKEWYLKLGTHNSLYGSTEELMRAAAVVGLNLPRNQARGNHIADFIGQVNENGTFMANRPKAATLSAQMLIDASRDPQPTINTATRLGLLKTAKTITGRTVGQFKTKAEAAAKKRSELDPEDQKTFSDAIKFNFEARSAQLETQPESYWQAQFTSTQEQAAEHGPKSEAAKLIDRVDDVEGLRNHNLLKETLAQATELKEATKYLSNGELTEHYFNLLLRHMVLSKDGSAKVMSTTERQDAPHDRIKSSGLGRLSHDAVIKDYEPNRTLYVQLKAGSGIDASGYHDELVVVNPFGETGVDTNGMTDEEKKKALSEENKAVRTQVVSGIAQLRGLLTELVTGEFYEGATSQLQSHVDAVKDAFQAKLHPDTEVQEMEQEQNQERVSN